MTNKELINSSFAVEFSKKISPNTSLEIIPVKKESFAIKNECFENVKKQVSIKGGKIVYGWTIHPHVINGLLVSLEAEAHAIWLNNKKEKICISPQDCKEIIFIGDNNDFVKNNNALPNYRATILKDITSINLIKVFEIRDFTNIEIKKYITTKMGKPKKIFPLKLSFKENEVEIHYGGNGFVTQDEQVMKLCVIFARTQQIEKNPFGFNLISEVYNMSKEINYNFKFYIQT